MRAGATYDPVVSGPGCKGDRSFFPGPSKWMLHPEMGLPTIPQMTYLSVWSKHVNVRKKINNVLHQISQPKHALLGFRAKFAEGKGGQDCITEEGFVKNIHISCDTF